MDNSVKVMKENLERLLSGHKHKDKLIIIFEELLDFMIYKDWRGACHESCGVQYVLLSEFNIGCEWKLGEVRFKNLKTQGRPVYFDHSWIVIENEIFDMALYKTNIPMIDSYPTIRNKNLLTMGNPGVVYNTNSGWGDDIYTEHIKTMPLSKYFDKSPLHEKLGTWSLIQKIGQKLDVKSTISQMREKYNGIYWK